MGRDRREQQGKRGAQGRGHRSQHRSQAKKLVRETGLPESTALSVVKGEVSLSEAIAALARADQVKMLMRKHDLPKGVATQVALEQTDLETYLLKRRLKEYMAAGGERSFLDSLAGEGETVWFALHGPRRFTGALLEVGRYELSLQAEGEEAESVHKLQVKLAARGVDAERVEAEIEMAPGASATGPVAAPQDRYHLSNRRLMAFKEAGDCLQVSMLEGETLYGHVDWFSRWEIGIRSKASNTEVVVFRHAIVQLERH